MRSSCYANRTIAIYSSSCYCIQVIQQTLKRRYQCVAKISRGSRSLHFSAHG